MPSSSYQTQLMLLQAAALHLAGEEALHLAGEDVSSCPRTPLSKRSKEEEEALFNTPKTDKTQLKSSPSTCPPPPRKPRLVLGCKRSKKSKQKLIMVEKHEIELLFSMLESHQKVKKEQILGPDEGYVDNSEDHATLPTAQHGSMHASRHNVSSGRSGSEII